MEIKDAVQTAIAFATESLGAERTRSIRLEEVETSSVDGRPVWQITLSSILISDSRGINSPTGTIPMPPWMAIGADAEREYKVFTVAKDNGDVLSMKIRLLAAPTGPAQFA